jgi:uncharacterized protein (DUF2384 family)
MLFNILGFKDSEFPAGLGWHDKICQGFHERAIWALSRALRVPAPETAKLVRYVGQDFHWKNRTALLTPGTSETLFRIAVAYHRLFAVLKDEDIVVSWLRNPRQEVLGLVPVILLTSEPGVMLVMEAIAKIKPPKTVERSVADETPDEDEDSASEKSSESEARED